MPLIGYEKDLITKLLFCSFLYLGVLRLMYPNKFKSLAFVFISSHQLIKLNGANQRRHQSPWFYMLFGLLSIALFSYLAYLSITAFGINFAMYNDEILFSLIFLLIGLSVLKYFWFILFRSLSRQKEELSNYRIHKCIYIFASTVICFITLTLYNYSNLPKESFLTVALFTLAIMVILGYSLAFLLYLKKVGFITGIYTLLFNDFAPYIILFLLFYFLRSDN